MRGKNKSESHCTETAQHHHHHESSFLVYIYIYTILYIPGFHVCDYNAQVMEVHIESYF
jgi:hypothetical protein